MKNFKLLFQLATIAILFQGTLCDFYLPSSYARINKEMTLYWDFLNDSSILLGLECRTVGYCSIGLGIDMSDSDIFSLEYDGNTPIVTDRYSSNHREPGLDQNIGGTNDYTNVSYNIVDGVTRITWNRKLNTNDKKDHVIEQGTQKMIWAYSTSSKQFSYHDANYGVVSVNMVPGFKGDATAEDSVVMVLHAWFLVISWGVLVDIGIIASRFMKAKKGYLGIHILCFLFTDLSTLVFGIWMLLYKSDASSESPSEEEQPNIHNPIGIVVLVLVVIQHTLGVSSKVVGEKKQYKDVLPTIKKIHRIIGHSLYVITKVEVALGAALYDKSWVPGLLIWYLIAILIRLYIEYVYFQKKNFSLFYSYEPLEGNSEINDIKTKLNSGQVISEIIKSHSQILWVTYNDNIYDLTKFKHPGGEGLIHESIGRDVGRFLSGSYNLENTKKSKNVHSIYAYRMFESFKVGEINDKSKDILVDVSTNQTTKGIFDFTLKQKRKISTTASFFDLKCNILKTKNYLPGTKWIGKYFNVQLEGTNKQRYYTVIISMSQSNITLRQNIILYFEQCFFQKTNNIDKNQLRDIAKEYEDTLVLAIKKYNIQGALSKQIHELNINDKIVISGAYGYGHMISAETEGHIILFAGGTGLYPYIDFLDYLLKKTMYTLLKQRNNEQAEDINVFNEDYDNNLARDLRVSLYASFNEVDDIIGLDILQKLTEYNNQLINKNFDAKIRISKGTAPPQLANKLISAKFERDFIRKQVPQNVTRVYICGPPSMNYDIPVFLKQEHNFEADKIIIV